MRQAQWGVQKRCISSRAFIESHRKARYGMKTFDEIREIYVAKYPYLAKVRYGREKKSFANVALMLGAPKGVTANDLWKLTQIANGKYFM